MGMRQHKPEGVIAKLRQAHVRIAQGRSVVGEWLRRKHNARQRNGISGGEVLCILMEAQILTEIWRHHDDTVRPYGPLGCRPPAPERLLPASKPWPAALTP